MASFVSGSLHSNSVRNTWSPGAAGLGGDSHHHFLPSTQAWNHLQDDLPVVQLPLPAGHADRLNPFGKIAVDLNILRRFRAAIGDADFVNNVRLPPQRRLADR